MPVLCISNIFENLASKSSICVSYVRRNVNQCHLLTQLNCLLTQVNLRLGLTPLCIWTLRYILLAQNWCYQTELEQHINWVIPMAKLDTDTGVLNYVYLRAGVGSQNIAKFCCIFCTRAIHCHKLRALSRRLPVREPPGNRLYDNCTKLVVPWVY